MHMHLNASIQMECTLDNEKTSNSDAPLSTSKKQSGIPVRELLSVSDAVVLCIGLQERHSTFDVKSKEKGQLRGVFDAREVVEWYNGHPYRYKSSQSQCSPYQSEVGKTLANVLHQKSNNICILGVGNVAIDIARILTMTDHDLKKTDITDEARAVIAGHTETKSTRQINIIGRRSLAQASFTPKEIRELMTIHSQPAIVNSSKTDTSSVNDSDVTFTVNDDGALVDFKDEEVMKGSRIRKRAYDTVMKFAKVRVNGSGQGTDRCTVNFHFRRTPLEVLEDVNDKGSVGGLVVRRNPTPIDGSMPDETAVDVIPSGVIIRAFGYSGCPIAGIPWDSRRGVVPTVNGGRIVEMSLDGKESTVPIRGMYASGWIRRGASGIIATNIDDAEDVAMAIHQDLTNDKMRLGCINQNFEAETDRVKNLIQRYCSSPILSYDDWRKVDSKERSIGKKLVTVEAMLEAAEKREIV